MLVSQSARVSSLDSHILCALVHCTNAPALAQDELSRKHMYTSTQQHTSHMVAELRGCSTAPADMAEYVQRVGEQLSELLVEGWNLLPLVYKVAIGSRRAAWRVITSLEQKEKFKGKEQLVSHAKEYVAKVEGELQKIRDGILALMDKKPIPSPSTDESKTFYYKMKGDYYRYLAEFATGDAKSKACEDACFAYAEATQIAEKDLVVTHPIRLAMALNSSVFQSEVLQSPEDCDPDFAGDVHVGKNDLDVPVVVQRQISMVQTVQKTKEIPQLQCIDKVVDDPVVQIPQMQVVGKTVEGPQVHFTGVMKPDDPDAKIKFLAEEELHGVGGFVFDAHGNRVANELGGRNCVTGEMWKNEPPFGLAPNKVTSDDIAWQCKHHTGRGVKLHESGTAIVEDMEAPVSKTPDSIEAHDQASLKTTRDPNVEPYPAFSSGKSWNEASGKTGSEKKFNHNVSSRGDSAAQPNVAENEGPRPEVTNGHDAHVVECVTAVTTRTVAHRQVPLIQRVQKMVEVPQVQFIDKVVDIPVIRQRQMSVGACGGCAESQGEEEQEEREMGGSFVQGGEHRREEDETDTQVPGSELVPVAPNMGAGGSHPQATMDQERDKELCEIRRMVEFLVHRERKLDVKTDVAARRLERLERESSQLEDEERGSSLGEALTDRTKVVKLIVDKWFVDKGYGCRQGIRLWQGSHW